MVFRQIEVPSKGNCFLVLLMRKSNYLIENYIIFSKNEKHNGLYGFGVFESWFFLNASK